MIAVISQEQAEKNREICKKINIIKNLQHSNRQFNFVFWSAEKQATSLCRGSQIHPQKDHLGSNARVIKLQSELKAASA